MRFIRLCLVSLLGATLFAACSRGDTVTAQQIMDGIKQTRETTEDAHAVAAISMTGNSNRDGNFVIETWLRKSDKKDAAGKPLSQSHIKVIQASRDELADSEIVNDGETVWIYNPKQNRVITGKLRDLQQGSAGTQDPTAQMMRMQEQLQELIDGSNVEILADNETVAGMAAWKVKLTPKPETAQQLQIGGLVDTTMGRSRPLYPAATECQRGRPRQD